MGKVEANERIPEVKQWRRDKTEVVGDRERFNKRHSCSRTVAEAKVSFTTIATLYLGHV